jgi:hypothetical protein
MLLLGTLGFLNSATKVEANGTNISINPTYLSTRLPSILELVEPCGPRHVLAPLPEPGLPPQGGPVPLLLGILITPFANYWLELLARGIGHWSNARGDSVDL